MDRGAEGASLTVSQTNGSPVLALSATLQGVRSAPTDTVGDAADGRRSMRNASFGTALSVPHAVFRANRTQHHPLSAISAKNCLGNAYSGPKRRRVVEVKVLSRLCTVTTWDKPNRIGAAARLPAVYL